MPWLWVMTWVLHLGVYCIWGQTPVVSGKWLGVFSVCRTLATTHVKSLHTTLTFVTYANSSTDNNFLTILTFSLALPMSLAIVSSTARSIPGF